MKIAPIGPKNKAKTMPQSQRTLNGKRKSLSSSSSTSRYQPQNKRRKQKESLAITDSSSGIVLVRAENEGTQKTSVQVRTKRQWILVSLVRDIVKEEYKKQNMENLIAEDLNLLNHNRVKEWVSLSEEDKKLFPVTLIDILDDASLP